MSALSQAELDKIWRVFMRRRQASGSYTKAQLAAAVAAADGWADSNAASYNSSLPLAFRTSASTSEKAVLLAFVCLQRAGLLEDVG